MNSKDPKAKDALLSSWRQGHPLCHKWEICYYVFQEHCTLSAIAITLAPRTLN